MLFNSLEYFFFFPIVVALYYLIPARFRWALLLGASYIFYMSWKVEYIILIMFSTLVDYIVAIKISEAKSQKVKKRYLIFSLFSNLGLLASFKYANFISDNINGIFSFFHTETTLPYWDILLPVGISFYTFQTLSYTIDIYNGKLKPERNLGRFALYVTYFPQLVAGPIERAVSFIPELKKKVTFNSSDVVSGLRRILWGLFKKVVVADRISVIVNHVYETSGQQNGLTLLLATYLFAIQIYCDFSGYSDIAIGSSRVLGIKLMENFKAPYFSKSISEFWSRWHISLSTWFRDYVYIPLGGSRVKLSLVIVNILIVFLISGFWHGANWTFIVWGAIHGILLILERLFSLERRRFNNKATNIIRMILCFNLVVLAWVFFRSNSVNHAYQILSSIFNFPSWQFDVSNFSSSVGGILMVTLPKLLTSLTFLCLMLCVEYGLYHRQLKQYFFKLPQYQRWAAYYILIICVVVFGNHGDIEFIYFQF